MTSNQDVINYLHLENEYTDNWFKKYDYKSEIVKEHSKLPEKKYHFLLIIYLLSKIKQSDQLPRFYRKIYIMKSL